MVRTTIAMAVVLFSALEVYLYYPDYSEPRFVINMALAWIAAAVAWYKAKGS